MMNVLAILSVELCEFSDITPDTLKDYYIGSSSGYWYAILFYCGMVGFMVWLCVWCWYYEKCKDYRQTLFNMPTSEPNIRDDKKGAEKIQSFLCTREKCDAYISNKAENLEWKKVERDVRKYCYPGVECLPLYNIIHTAHTLGCEIVINDKSTNEEIVI